MQTRYLVCLMVLFFACAHAYVTVGTPTLGCWQPSCCQGAGQQWTTGTVLGVPAHMCCATGEVIQNSAGVCCKVEEWNDCV